MYIIIERKPVNIFIIKDDNGNKKTYFYYTKTQALKDFKESFNLKFKRVNVLDYN